MELGSVKKLLGSHSAAEYRAALLALLPGGRIWDAERKNPKGDKPKGELYRLCEIWASEYAQLEETLYSLHSETGPISAKELTQWLNATGTPALEHSELTQRVRALIALIGSQASTAKGFADIAMRLGYEAKLKQSGAQKIEKTLELKSKKTGHRDLATEIDAEKVARYGSYRFGERLWPNTKAIHRTIAAKSTHRQTKSECEIIEGLLPAHLGIETRYL